MTVMCPLCEQIFDSVGGLTNHMTYSMDMNHKDIENNQEAHNLMVEAGVVNEPEIIKKNYNDELEKEPENEPENEQENEPENVVENSSQIPTLKCPNCGTTDIEDMFKLTDSQKEKLEVEYNYGCHNCSDNETLELF